jgi:hypothetical protein
MMENIIGKNRYSELKRQLAIKHMHIEKRVLNEVRMTAIGF